MQVQPSSESTSLGEILMHARLRRGLTQEELGKDSGIGQAAIAKLERNRTVPKVPTLCRYLRALSLTPEEELEVWYKIRGNVREIDWVERLGIDDFDVARSRAQQRLHAGEIYDAYGYIEAMHQLARDNHERAWAEMLHANRSKDLGLYDMAQRYYEQAAKTLGSGRFPKTMTRIMLNMADLKVEREEYVMADVYVQYALTQEMDPSSRAYAFLVKARLTGADPTREEEAMGWFEKAETAYRGLTTDHLRDAGLAWSRVWRANTLARSSAAERRREGERQLRQLATAYGPASSPANAEVFARVCLALGEHADDATALDHAVRLAKKGGFRSILERARQLRGGLAVALFCLFLGAVAPHSASARPRDTDVPDPPSVQNRTRASESRGEVRSDNEQKIHAGAGMDWVSQLIEMLLSPLGYLPPDMMAMKGDGESFSDNGPEE